MESPSLVEVYQGGKVVAVMLSVARYQELIDAAGDKVALASRDKSKFISWDELYQRTGRN